jgi:predicted TPR repeat methyltransferase
VRILRGHGITSGRVVDAGCGSGILSRRLVDAGYDVIGFDISPAMIRLARLAAPDATFRVAPLATARIPPCCAVVAAGEVVSYAPSLAAFFKRVASAVEPGGLFVFDFVESAKGRTYPLKGVRGADWALLVSAEADATGRTLTRRITTFRRIGGALRRSREVHRVRLHGRQEIARMLADVGFRATMKRSYGKFRLMASDVAVVAEKQ